MTRPDTPTPPPHRDPQAPLSPTPHRSDGHHRLCLAIGQHDLTFLTLGCGERQRITHPDQAYRVYLDALYAGDDIRFENHDGSVTIQPQDL